MHVNKSNIFLLFCAVEESQTSWSPPFETKLWPFQILQKITNKTTLSNNVLQINTLLITLCINFFLSLWYFWQVSDNKTSKPTMFLMHFIRVTTRCRLPYSPGFLVFLFTSSPAASSLSEASPVAVSSIVSVICHLLFSFWRLGRWTAAFVSFWCWALVKRQQRRGNELSDI